MSRRAAARKRNTSDAPQRSGSLERAPSMPEEADASRAMAMDMQSGGGPKIKRSAVSAYILLEPTFTSSQIESPLSFVEKQKKHPTRYRLLQAHFWQGHPGQGHDLVHVRARHNCCEQQRWRRLQIRLAAYGN